MEIYLPIAEVSLDVFVLLTLGGAVGFLSGVFGVGGGFLLTPFLIFIGVPPAVAVASSANQLVGASVSGVLAHWKRGNVDFKMGAILLIGGFLGSLLGVWLFGILRRLGQIELVINLCFVILLGTLGALMLVEGTRTLLRRRRVGVPRRKLHQHTWIHGLPLKMRFKRSKIYLSVIPVIVVGLFIGFIGAVMGIGGGFILVPIMIYVLRVPTSTVIGTSMVLTLVTMLFATMLHAVTNHLVDAVLALILMVGGVTGAQFGARAGQKIRGEHLRLLLGLLILAVGIRFAVELVIRPDDLFTIRESGGTG
jgi:uncharacterized protein